QTGDVLIIYSDGLTDALNKKGNLYGNERLLELSSKENINVSNINIEVNKFADGTRLPDDLTITMIKCI
ncbi:MAG TPA: SpoIIE family protein phosphatase, partial [Ignavibacteria bacterium]|nr:SpoIIE family protein phosphatase [Ignavibacteria bacterium]